MDTNRPSSGPLGALRGARAFLTDPKNWHRGASFGPDGSRCAIGALVWASDDGRATDVAQGALQRAMRDVDPRVGLRSDGGWSAGAWNDDPSRTHGQVLEAFDRAIGELEAAAR